MLLLPKISLSVNILRFALKLAPNPYMEKWMRLTLAAVVVKITSRCDVEKCMYFSLPLQALLDLYKGKLYVRYVSLDDAWKLAVLARQFIVHKYSRSLIISM